MFHDPPQELIAEVLDELERRCDLEHADVSLTHETEWCLSVFRSGLIVFENLEAGEPRHLRADRRKAEELWAALAAGDLAAIEQQDWLPGYG